MPINLSKGQKVDLTKGNPGLDSILAGLGWDTNRYDGGHDFDLDVSIFMTNEQGKVDTDTNFVFYNNPKDAAGSVVYSGDNRTGEGEGDDETVNITLRFRPMSLRFPSPSRSMKHRRADRTSGRCQTHISASSIRLKMRSFSATTSAKTIRSRRPLS